MKVYLVRHIETKEIQGIFWGDKSEVWDTFDELSDPSDCEYASLPSGGAIYTRARYGEGRTADQIPAPIDDVDDCDITSFSWEGFEASEVLSEALHRQYELKWHRFDFSDEGVGLMARIKKELE